MAAATVGGISPEANGEEPIGMTFGDLGTTSVRCTVVHPVERNEYVAVPHEVHGPVLGQVVEVERKTDLSLEKALTASIGAPLEVHDREFATIAILGYRDPRGLLQTPRTPFRAGESVHKASPDFIRSVLGLGNDRDHGAYLGLLSGHDMPIYVDINAMVQKHVCILAKTGGGKSYASGVLMEELMKHGVTVVILDPHGEYGTLSEPASNVQDRERFNVAPRGYSDRLQEYSPDINLNPRASPLRFSLRNIRARDLMDLTTQRNNRSSLAALKAALEALQASDRPFDLGDVIRVLQGDEEGGHDALVAELEYLRDGEIFAGQGTRMEELVAQGRTTIINLKGTPPDVQGLIADRLATALFELRKMGKVPPMMLVMEEAHTFCPQVGQVASSRILRTIASEGRKFGLGLLIITQRAAKVDKNVLSQCNLQVILKVTNPNDLKAITSSVEGITKGMEEEIQRLPVGMALVMGANFAIPLFVDVRPRETKHGGESVKVLQD